MPGEMEKCQEALPWLWPDVILNDLIQLSSFCFLDILSLNYDLAKQSQLELVMEGTFLKIIMATTFLIFA